MVSVQACGLHIVNETIHTLAGLLIEPLCNQVPGCGPLPGLCTTVAGCVARGFERSVFVMAGWCVRVVVACSSYTVSEYTSKTVRA